MNTQRRQEMNETYCSDEDLNEPLQTKNLRVGGLDLQYNRPEMGRDRREGKECGWGEKLQSK